jgi:hypothetical protein
MTDEQRRQIGERLAAVEQAASPGLAPLIDQTRVILRAKPALYTAETMEALVAILDDLGSRAADGAQLKEIVEGGDVDATRFMQANWQLRDAYNAQQLTQVIFNQSRPADEPTPLGAPVVLVAMSSAQAGELANGDAFTDHPPQLQAQFCQLIEVLTNEGIGDWSERYGENGRAWQPFGAAGPSIESLVSETFAQVNSDEAYSPPILPVLHEIGEIDEDRRLLRKLRESCLVIVDSVSMRHPQLQRWFHRSMLDAYPTTAMLFFAPIHGAVQAGRELSMYVMLSHDQLEFSRRQNDSAEDYGVCIETGDPDQLGLWLARRVRKLAPEIADKRGVHKFMRVGPGSP